jgi:hypothetical protein
MRRLDSVRDELADALYDIDPCNYTTFDGYESRISAQILDGLHYLYYLDDNFDLKRVKEELIDMFYVDITERYFEGITNC